MCIDITMVGTYMPESGDMPGCASLVTSLDVSYHCDINTYTVQRLSQNQYIKLFFWVGGGHSYKLNLTISIKIINTEFVEF